MEEEGGIVLDPDIRDLQKERHDDIRNVTFCAV